MSVVPVVLAIVLVDTNVWTSELTAYDSKESTIIIGKYDITKHKRYKELADFNKNNAFDVEKYLAHRLVMSEDTEFEMYEVTVTQEDVSAIEAEEGED